MFLFGTFILEKPKSETETSHKKTKGRKDKRENTGFWMFFLPLISTSFLICVASNKEGRKCQKWTVLRSSTCYKEMKKIFLIIAIWKEWSRKMRIKRWNDVEIFSNYNSRIQSRPFSGNEEKWIRILIAGKVCRIF